MTDVLVGDALLELAKAKELASVMGGAWHDAEDAESDSEQKRDATKLPPTPVKPGAANGGTDNNSNGIGSGGGFIDLVSTPLRRTLYRRKTGSGDSSASIHGSSTHSVANGSSHHRHGGGGSNAAVRDGNGRAKSYSSLHAGRPGGGGGGGGSGRRPANGKAPGRRDPAAVARLEAQAKEAAAQRAREGTDPSWQLPTNVDYYTDRAALLRELVKEMPPDKRLSFQTRVANARTKEAVDSLMHDYATRLECLVLPHARSREMDPHQVKKDMARERVVFDGKEVARTETEASPSDHPHAWHEELWATVETRVTEALVQATSPVAGGEQGGTGGVASKGENLAAKKGPERLGAGTAARGVDMARALAAEEWKKARAVAATSEVFKAMSRTGAGGDAYFALVALFCTADKLVVPVACQESPINVDFLHQQKDSKSQSLGGGGGSKGSSSLRGKGSGGAPRSGEDVHVVVTVPSTFDIYLRESQQSGRGGRGGGGSSSGRGGGRGGGKNQRGSGAADASIALHLVRVRAVVEEEIWVAGSTRLPASNSNVGSGGGGRTGLGSRNSSASGGGAGGASREDDVPPSMRFLLDQPRDERRPASGDLRGRRDAAEGGGGGRRSGGGDSSDSMTPPPPPPAPLLTLTRTERRMRVTVVPEPSAVSEMMRNFSRKIGVDVPGPQPPRVFGM